MKGTEQIRFTVLRRGRVYYCENRATEQQNSFITRDEAEAQWITSEERRGETTANELGHGQYLPFSARPEEITRIWTGVVERFCDHSNDNMRMRHEHVCPHILGQR